MKWGRSYCRVGVNLMTNSVVKDIRKSPMHLFLNFSQNNFFMAWQLQVSHCIKGKLASRHHSHIFCSKKKYSHVATFPFQSHVHHLPPSCAAISLSTDQQTLQMCRKLRRPISSSLSWVIFLLLTTRKGLTQAAPSKLKFSIDNAPSYTSSDFPNSRKVYHLPT